MAAKKKETKKVKKVEEKTPVKEAPKAKPKGDVELVWPHAISRDVQAPTAFGIPLVKGDEYATAVMPAEKAKVELTRAGKRFMTLEEYEESQAKD